MTPPRLKALADASRELEAKLRLGGGPERIAKQHAQGKLTARERVAALKDPGTPFLEFGLLVAHDLYEGEAPAAGVLTGIIEVEGRECVVVANRRIQASNSRPPWPSSEAIRTTRARPTSVGSSTTMGSIQTRLRSMRAVGGGKPRAQTVT